MQRAKLARDGSASLVSVDKSVSLSNIFKNPRTTTATDSRSKEIFVQKQQLAHQSARRFVRLREPENLRKQRNEAR